MNVLVAAQGHHNLFERGVAGAFADAVDRHLGLPGAVQDAAQRIGRSHAQVVVAMGGDDRPVDVRDMIDEVFDLGAVFVRKAVARRVGDVDHGGAGGNGRLDDARQVLDVGPACVLGVELHILDIAFGIFHRRNGPFENLFRRRAQFVVNMLRRHADTRMDTLVLGKTQSVGRHVDVLLHGTRQRTDRRFGNGFGNFQHGIEIPGAGNRETGLDHVHAEILEQFGYLDFFGGVQLTAGNLLTIAERGVENVQSLTHN